MERFSTRAGAFSFSSKKQKNKRNQVDTVVMTFWRCHLYFSRRRDAYTRSIAEDEHFATKTFRKRAGLLEKTLLGHVPKIVMAFRLLRFSHLVVDNLTAEKRLKTASSHVSPSQDCLRRCWVWFSNT